MSRDSKLVKSRFSKGVTLGGGGRGEGWGLVRELYAPNRREAMISLRSKRFRASSSRKIETRAKKKGMTNFRAITRLETLASQVRP